MQYYFGSLEKCRWYIYYNVYKSNLMFIWENLLAIIYTVVTLCHGILKVNNENNKFLQFVGPSCGHHASYTFYKAIKYVKNGHTKILSLGEFFFVKIWPNSDLVAIGELQLLWDDKNTNQTLSSLRLYFLPEYTPDGRMHYHGEVSTILYYLFLFIKRDEEGSRF